MLRANLAGVLFVLLIGTSGVSADETRQIGDRLKLIEELQARNIAAMIAHRSVDPIARQTLKDELSALCEIDPSELLSSERVTLAECCLKARRFDDCTRYASVAVSNEPSEDSANSLLIKSLVYLKRFDEAAAALESAKVHVTSTSRVRGLHSLIYFQLAAHKEWQRAAPHIEKHIQHLENAAANYLEEPVQQHFWVDQLALAYKHTIPDEADRRQKLDEHWRTMIALSPIIICPWKEASLRRRCAILELQCAIEVHAGKQNLDVRLSQWIETILESNPAVRDKRLVDESTLICQFIRTHGQKLEPSARTKVAAKLMEIEAECFRVWPAKPVQQLQSTLAETRKLLHSDNQRRELR